MEDMTQDELRLGDWYETVPTEKEIRESIESASAGLPMGESFDPDRYATPNEFVRQYSNALQDYLNQSLGKGESHLEDLVADSKAFSEAFLAIITHF
jgi:hypothetical protein